MTHPVQNKPDKVWVVTPLASRMDYTPALAYGEIVYVNGRYIYGDEISDDGTIPKGFMRELAAASMLFDMKNDYLLLAGDHLQAVIMASLIATRGPFRVLRYDRQAKGYIPVTIET